MEQLSKMAWCRVSWIVLTGSMLAGCGAHAAAEADPSGADEAAGGEVSAADAPAPGPGINPAAPGIAPAPDPSVAIDAPAAPPPVDPDSTTIDFAPASVQIAAANGTVQGRLFAARSAQTELEIIEADTRICVRGALSPVPNGDYANYWGGEVGLLLDANDPSDLAALDAGLPARGFAFRVQGELPPQLRLRVGAGGEVPLTSQYCRDVPVVDGSALEVPLDVLTSECWIPDGAPFPPGASAALVSWQIPASAELGGSFDFCIEDIRALP